MRVTRRPYRTNVLFNPSYARALGKIARTLWKSGKSGKGTYRRKIGSKSHQTTKPITEQRDYQVGYSRTWRKIRTGRRKAYASKKFRKSMFSLLPTQTWKKSRSVTATTAPGQQDVQQITVYEAEGAASSDLNQIHNEVYPTTANGGDDETHLRGKIYHKGCHMQYIMYAPSSNVEPAIVEVYEFTCKRNVPQTLATNIEGLFNRVQTTNKYGSNTNTSVSASTYGLTPFDVDSFSKYVNIKRKVTHEITPGGSVINEMYLPLNRTIALESFNNTSMMKNVSKGIFYIVKGQTGSAVVVNTSYEKTLRTKIEGVKEPSINII